MSARTIYFLSLVLLTLLSRKVSCQAQSLVGTWQLHHKKSDKEKLNQSPKDSLELDSADFLAEFGSLKITFYPDKVIATSGKRNGITYQNKGIWQYLQKDQRLLINIGNKAQMDTLEVLKVRKRQLVLARKSAKPLKLIFKPEHTPVDSSSNIPIVIIDKQEVFIPSESVMIDIIQSVPSPTYFLLLIQTLNLPYQTSFARNAPQKRENNLQSAWRLGRYFASLSYAVISEQKKAALNNIELITQEAQYLQLSKIIDFAEMKTINQNINDQDTLLYVNESYRENCLFALRSLSLESLSIVMLSASWLESLHIVLAQYQSSPNEILKNRIAEQKIILDQILLLLSFYKAEPPIKAIIQDLEQIQRIFEEVKMTFTMDKTENDLFAIDPQNSSIIFSNRTLRKLRKNTRKIRRKRR